MDEHDQGTYKHLPFKTERQIRLLHLSQRSESAGVVYRFSTHAIESLPSYTALSYTWGDPAPVAKLHLSSGRYLNVAQNLADFLSTVLDLRTNTNKAMDMFWIDALCIDQANVDERNSQVKLMSMIYRGATDVLVWLGPESEDSRLAAAFISTLTAVLSSLDAAAKGSVLLLQEQSGIPPADDPRWMALLRLICRPWFERIWVQQEIILASSVLMACGHAWISWHDLASLVKDIYDNQLYILLVKQTDEMGNHQLFKDRITILHHMHSATRAGDEARVMTVLEHLVDLTICAATNPRDKIYGLLGISKPISAGVAREGLPVLSIDVNYRCMVDELYTDFARTALVGDCSNALLPCAAPSRSSRALPSWVPDWSFYENGHGGPTLKDWSIHAGWNACGNSLVHARVSGNANEIYMSGVHVGIIKDVSPILKVDDFPEPRRDSRDVVKHSKILEWLRAVEELARPLDPYLTTQNWKHACWHTLMIEMLWDGDPMPKSWDPEEEYQLLRMYLSEDNETAKAGSLGWSREKWSKFERFMSALKSTVARRVFSVLGNGYMGLVPQKAQPGDLVSVLLGHVNPFVLCPDRQLCENGSLRYTVIGECYVHGIMDGESLEGVVPVQDFLLI